MIVRRHAPYRALGHYGRAFGSLSFGALPEKTEFIPINDPGPPIDVGDMIFGISRNLGRVDGLAPGNTRVPNFEVRYKYAKKLSEQVEKDYKITSPIRKLCKRFDDELGEAMRRVFVNYKWNAPCWIGSDPESPIWDNCRTKDQVDRLKTALADVNNALNKYTQIELAMTKAVCPDSPDCNDYFAPDPSTVVTTSPPPTSTVTTTPDVRLTTPTAERRTTSTEYRSTIADDEGFPWGKLAMYGIPAVLALGVGGALLLKKPRAAAVAGYRRRRR